MMLDKLADRGAGGSCDGHCAWQILTGIAREQGWKAAHQLISGFRLGPCLLPAS
jgi:hypothetical protein